MRIMQDKHRRIAWLMAEKSFEGLVGWLASSMGAIPVSRAQDITKAGQGIVYLPYPSDDPLILRGKGTNFEAASFTVGGAILLPLIDGKSYKFVIGEIRGPGEIVLKKPPTSSEAIRQLTTGTIFKVTPYVDQTAVYNAVFDSLNAGGCIGIFPEGGSHDRSEMLPLKGNIMLFICLILNHANGPELALRSWHSVPSRKAQT